MRFLVGSVHVIGGEVGVDFGRGDVGVPEEGLHATEIRSALEKMRREGMPELVW